MKRILVVEDDAALREMIHDTLEVLGYEVDLAENGEQVLPRLAGNLPDLVLLDIQIPVFDGFSVLKRIRQTPQLAALKVVALSAFAMRGDDQKALAAGFDAYLTKPIAIADLRKKVQQMLNDS
ncbi:MAG TPA: response regulator [Terriglobales bacterium]|jgi:CheY-like chemotaxis protein|nr:response regulator [Terriglobales bacterium]